jgi:putative hydrolase of HD superfamily
MFQFKNDIDFLFEIGTLRRIARTWNQFFGTEVANDTEHTFRVAWIALILAKHENVENTGHILELALIHDIGEIRTGDVNYLSRQYTSSDEEQAVHDTFE